MQIAGAHWMFSEPLRCAIPRLVRAGCDAVALSGEPDAIGDSDALADVFAESGIAAWSVLAMLEGRDRNLAASDPGVRVSARACLEEMVDLVARLGGELVTFTPAPLGRLAPADNARIEWGRYVEGLKVVAAHAADRGVSLALEPLIRFETYLLHRAEQALALVADIGAENVGVCLDTFHMHVEERCLSDAIRLAGDRLLDLHLADSNRGAPGEGSIDWAGVRAAVADVGYGGAWTLEIDPPRDVTPTPQGWIADAQGDRLERCLATSVSWLRAAEPD